MNGLHPNELMIRSALCLAIANLCLLNAIPAPAEERPNVVLIVCDDLNDYMYFPRVGDELDSLTSMLFEAFYYFPRHAQGRTDDIRRFYRLRLVTGEDSARLERRESPSKHLRSPPPLLGEIPLGRRHIGHDMGKRVLDEN